MLSKSRDESQCTGAYHNPINRHVTELEPPNESSDYTQFKRSVYKPDTRERFHEGQKIMKPFSENKHYSYNRHMKS